MPEHDDQSSDLTPILTRALLTVTRVAREPRHGELDPALDQLHQCLNRETVEPAALKRAVEALKSEVVRVSLGAAPQADQPAGRPGPDLDDLFLSRIRETFLGLINEMEMDVGEQHVALVNALRRKITRETNWTDLLDLRPELENLLRQFAHQVFEERQKATAFISEVAQRLDELEGYLAASVEHIQSTHKSNTEFNRRMVQELDKTSDSVAAHEKLDELKQFIMTKLKTISEVVRRKQAKDTGDMKEASRNLGGVKQKVGGLQDEIKRVQDENKELLHKLRFDCLTGAYNRMAFDEFLAQEKNRFDRYRRPFSVIMFDIDHFKNINDSLGHLVGDKCLQECIRHIRPALRKNDILARFGGDEFVVLLPETNLDQAMETADKLRRTIEETEFYFRKKKLPLTISAGASEAAAEDPAAETVVNRADQALLEAKRMGKNTVRPAG